MDTTNPPTRAKAQSDIMVGTRKGDPEREAQGRRDLAEVKITAVINKALAASPPLGNQQIHRITALLRSGGAL